MVLDHIPGHTPVTDASPASARAVCHDRVVRDALRLTGFVLLCIIWGSTWLVIKVGYGGLGPLNVAGVRFAMAAVVLTILVPLVGARWLLFRLVLGSLFLSHESRLRTVHRSLDFVGKPI